MSRPPDPLGKRALFSAPLDGETVDARTADAETAGGPGSEWESPWSDPSTLPVETGRRSLFTSLAPADTAGEPGRPPADQSAPASGSHGQVRSGPAPGVPASRDPRGASARPDAGRSPVVNPRGRLSVACRSCGVSTSLGAVDLVARFVPSLWLPGLRWNRYLRCPACRRFAWCQVRWGSVRI